MGMEGEIEGTEEKRRSTCDRGFEYLHALSPPDEPLSVSSQAMVKGGEDVLCLHQCNLYHIPFIWEQTT